MRADCRLTNRKCYLSHCLLLPKSCQNASQSPARQSNQQLPTRSMFYEY
uniref:Uncharacterized protein n=1 Tax=Anguilla anguilla TaxID=7936 RepID=A0A0E9WNK0_ANGAN